MDKNSIYVGRNELNNKDYEVNGTYVEIENEKFYKIENFDKIPPFFMTIISDSDHWMFISSNGALTAGRKNPENTLFPYYTDDKITDSSEITGSKSILFINKNNTTYLWEPFSNKYENQYHIKRDLYKNICGNKLIFEEENLDLEIKFQYSWNNSEKFGFIKKSKIINIAKEKIEVEILDGIQNILPYGVERVMQNQFSTLVDAYKKNELLKSGGIGIYYLSSIPTDKAEPSEGLKATIVWSAGLDSSRYLLSSDQLRNFRRGEEITEETDIRAKRGAYFVNNSFNLNAGSHQKWYLITDINKDIAAIREIESLLESKSDITKIIEKGIETGTQNLIKIVSKADGLQKTEDELISSRHFSNVLFNVMRGGIFENGYTINKEDFKKYFQHFNKKLYQEQNKFIDDLPDSIEYTSIITEAEKNGNADFLRICYEYMPLSFSRRHGDPSRPWNVFSIETKNNDGSKSLNYQGNWRDIFQNWEALSLSFPGYIESLICKFVNATTADGYNPYRVTREGFDWEVIDPSDPWSNIGYWGDHQIIYLLKLLELSGKFHPGKIDSFLDDEIFVFANVPYCIKPYQDLLSNPQKTIDFNDELNKQVQEKVNDVGADGKLIFDNKGEIYKVNLFEKLLIPFLAKLSNFIPEAGIWMNTQRPEWNDANNALVGSGASMVTLYYMHRYIQFCLNIMQSSKLSKVKLSFEVSAFLNNINKILSEYKPLLEKNFSDRDRRTVLDALGSAAENYRSKIYKQGFCGDKSEISLEQLTAFFKLSLEYFGHSIKSNKRDDGFYQVYNLIKVVKNKIEIRHLYEMLEGQVAVLSSGFLKSNEVVEVLDALRKSKMYREDQNSYTLYPNRQLPLFMEKNNIPENLINKSELLKKLVDDNNLEIVNKDIKNEYHFNGQFRNKDDLKQNLEKLKPSKYKELVEKEFDFILEIFEHVFDHQSFTGRSGTFYKYEGLGCIYWHMVSKLLLVVQENYHKASLEGTSLNILEKIKTHYYQIKDGLGLKKSPEKYGAFPTDPYSHTPLFAGVQQPGMTGQVKEDIITRFSELGVKVRDGIITFKPELLKKEEFLIKEDTFTYFDNNSNLNTIKLEKNTLAFTFCRIPIIYKLSEINGIQIYYRNNKTIDINGQVLDKLTSQLISTGKSEIERITVKVIL